MRVTPITPIAPAKNPLKYKAQPILQGLSYSLRDTETGKIECCESEDDMWAKFDEKNGFSTRPPERSR